MYEFFCFFGFYFIQTTFRFAGALKLEEVVRALSTLFARYSTVPVRGKFARLREVLLVLTSDSTTPASIFTENFTQLTSNEVEAFISLRVDISMN